MSSTTDKVKGVANDVIGNAKQGIGKMTGDNKLRAEGVAQELKGEAQKAVGDTKSALKNAANPTVAKAFVAYVVGPVGQALLKKDGFGKP